MSIMVAGAEVRVDGRPLEPLLAAKIVEIRVENHAAFPDCAVVRLADPGLEHVDADPLPIGATLEVFLSAPESGTLTPVFSGRIAASEPAFLADSAVLAARAYDASHALTRTRRTRTFQQMTLGDVAQRIAREAGLRTGTLDATGAARAFIQQSDETDLELLVRLAATVDFEVAVEDDRLHFRRAGSAPAGAPTTLRWGDNLVAFRPRLTAAQQVEEVTVRAWDPASRRTIQAVARPPATDSTPGVQRSAIAPGSGALAVGDRPVLDQAEADRLAASVASRVAHAFVEAEGTSRGDPRLRAGGRVLIDGVGTRFGGTYALSSVSHQFRGGHGYVTTFAISGRTARGLAELARRPQRRPWGAGLVIGLVTQNEDPDGLGRVRVRYPVLGDDAEGWWARIAGPGAGAARGALMLPAIGDEVVVGFEHGDVRRPYVLGALWNGQARPEQLAQTDSSYVLHTDARLNLSADGDIAISGKQKMTITTDGEVKQSAGGDLTVEGQKVTVKASDALAVESSGEITLKAPQVTVSATGTLKLSGAQVRLG